MLGRRHGFRFFFLTTTAALACASHASTTPESFGDAGKSGIVVDGGALAQHSDARVAPVDAAPTSQCSGATHTVGMPPGPAPAPPAVTLPSGFTIEVIASIDSARELVSLPNGDLLVSTRASDVWIIPNAQSATPGAPILFTSVPSDPPVHGLAFLPESCTLAIASQHSVYAVAYRDAQTTATLGSPIAMLRTGPIAHSVDASVDTDTHVTTSLAFSGGKLFTAVGSSCNACVEVDPSRALVEEMNPDGTGVVQWARRVRNAIAVTTNPATGTVWIGGAGQDDLALGHPYEYFDALTLHAGVADYGWPDCEENQHVYVAGSSCADTVIPLVEFPAYSTLIGAAFYPADQGGAHTFPESYRGGVFVTAHGSWHTNPDGTYYSPPRVAYVAMNGDTPVIAADWADPTKQWTEFVGGFQLANGKTRIGRPTGVTVAADGSLFVSDDQMNEVYRIRPN
jgi:glucose/arabinose dehydrogenase